MTGPSYPTGPEQPGSAYPPAPPSAPQYPSQQYAPQGYAYPQGYGYTAPQAGNGMAVAALVLGIVSVVLSWVPFFDWVLAALAIIFGAVGISTANKRMGAGKGMAVAGMILGIITIALGVVFVVWVFAVFRGACTAAGGC
jgi:hypothetical protein